MQTRTTTQGPIDAVVTWVNGSDPVFKARVAYHRSKIGRFSLTYIPIGLNDTRFADSGEIRYCICSIRRFMPWIRNIYLVTDQQQPSFLDHAAIAKLRVTIVDHKVLFGPYASVLPTFNSTTIENILFRIPGLADKYVYFNDDFFVISPTQPTDFFSSENVVLRGRWRPLKSYGRIRTHISGMANVIYALCHFRERPMWLLQRMRAAKLAGLKKSYLEPVHAPRPIKRTTLEAYFAVAGHELKLKSCIKYRFRNLNQFGCHALSNYLEIRNGTFELIETEDDMTLNFNLGAVVDVKGKLEQLRDARYKFLCIQNLEMAPVEDRQCVERFLDSVIFE